LIVDQNAYFDNSSYIILLWREDNKTIIDLNDNATLPPTYEIENLSVAVGYKLNLSEGENARLWDVDDNLIDDGVRLNISSVDNDRYIKKAYFVSDVNYSNIAIFVNVSSFSDGIASEYDWKFCMSYGGCIGVNNNVTFNGKNLVFSFSNIDFGNGTSYIQGDRIGGVSGSDIKPVFTTTTTAKPVDVVEIISDIKEKIPEQPSWVVTTEIFMIGGGLYYAFVKGRELKSRIKIPEIKSRIKLPKIRRKKEKEREKAEKGRTRHGYNAL
jgi:hypothetical protein